MRSLAPSAAIAAAVVLVALTTRIGDWVVMTDELLYERLAISIAQPEPPQVPAPGTVATAARASTSG